MNLQSSAAATERTPLLASINANEAQETQLAGPLSSVSSSRKAPQIGRQIALDLLRGLLMALMAMDHTSVTLNAYVHGTGMTSEAATKLITQWNSDLPYILRTLTHLCASGFTMLMGVGIAFVTEGRLAQGMKSTQLAKHFTARAFAIFIVSIVAFAPILVRPPYLYLNAVLLALAIDYFLVGFLYLFIISTAEPFLVKCMHKLLSSSKASSSRPVNVSTNSSIRDTQKDDSFAKVMTYYFINAFILLASIVTLWTNIWTSPNQGECRAASLIFQDEISPRCHLNRYFFFDLFFGMASCPNLHINSAFPPIGWISFALFGLLYGRILIHGHFKSTSKVIVFNISLSLLFALLFISTRLFSYGNLTTHCLATPDQPSSTSPHSSNSNQYLASFKSFFYIAKYPPSPAFAFFTLSSCYMLIALFAALCSASSPLPIKRILTSKWNPLLVFGTQPLFFYATHISFLWTLSIPILKSSLARDKPSGTPGRDRGVDLGWIFVGLLVTVLVIEYFACILYSRFKLQRGRESIWRFL